MFYPFADNITLEETRDVISRHNEQLGVKAFIEADRGDFIIFNYVVSFAGSFPELTGDPVRDREIAIIRECRGITFDKLTGKVAIRKFQKFHNVGERPDTLPQAIDWSVPHRILIKLDGSMLTPYYRNDGTWEFHTKMGSTDVAQPVNEFVSEHPHYIEFAEYCRKNNDSPIYEWCTRKQKIVIDYSEDNLVLLAIRNKITGEYVPYHEMVTIAEKYSIPVVETIEGSVTDIDAFLETTRVLKGEEGYVVRFDNGHMVKVKAEEYLRLHNMVDMLQLEKNVLSLILSDSIDDAKSLMDDDSRIRVESFIEDVERGIHNYAERLQEYVNHSLEIVGDDKKRLAIEFINIDKIVSYDRPLLFQIANGKNSIDVVKDYIRKNVNTSSKVEYIRPLIGNIAWEHYRNKDINLDD